MRAPWVVQRGGARRRSLVLLSHREAITRHALGRSAKDDDALTGSLAFPCLRRETWGTRFVRYEASLIEEHGAVEGVALDGLEAGVADDAPEFFLGGAVRCAGSFDDVLFEHDGAYIVAAKVEAELEDLEALRDPAGLHVLDVVEIKARDGEHLEVFDGGGFFPSAAAESGVAPAGSSRG